MPIEIQRRRGQVTKVDKEEHFRPGLTTEGLANLKPAFRKDGSVTAGNSSGINAGAAAMIIMTQEKADELGIKPIAKFIRYDMGA